MKDEILRLVDIPLIIKLPGMQQVPRGTQVKLDLLHWDEVDLTVEARLLEIAATVVVEPISDVEEELTEAADSDNETTTTDANIDVQPVPD